MEAGWHTPSPVPFPRFPFAVLYSLTETEIVVAGVIDLRKAPETVQKRKQKS